MKVMSRSQLLLVLRDLILVLRIPVSTSDINFTMQGLLGRIFVQPFALEKDEWLQISGEAFIL